MKRSYLIPLLILLVLNFSCKTSYINIRVKEPAVVSLPPDLERVGLVDRTLPDPKNKVNDEIDKIFSIEGKELDEKGAEATLKGLETELLRNDRFTDVRILVGEDIRSVGSGVFPAPLSWEVVDDICVNNGVDGIFVLEIYDTDSNVDYQMNPTEMKTPIGGVPAVEHVATVKTRINTGWRIYDPATRLILDEHMIYDNLALTGRGINPAKAANALIGRDQAIMDISGKIGASYSTRILPYYSRVSRTYFTKGTNNFDVGKRRADAGNWDGARESWMKETNNRKAKLAGRACVNVAIVYEIDGDLEEAMKWASKAYEDYGEKTGLEYLRALRNRKARIERLQNQ